MAWERLAHVELSSTDTTISTGTFTAKENLKFVFYGIGNSSNQVPAMTFNNDTGSNYARRQQDNGNSDETQTSHASIKFNDKANTGVYIVGTITNKADEEKLLISEFMSGNTAGAGNAPNRMEVIGKWVNTSDQITRIDFGLGTSDWASGSYITVFGASSDVTSDEKTALTNVEAGTRYEETDTRKIYRAYAITNTPTPDTTTSSGNTILKFTDAGSYTFTPSANFNVEYLVVGGGGGGGNENWSSARGAGGGGAGAYRTATGFSVTSGTEYTVTVGDGGIGGLQTGGGSCGTSYEPYLYQGTKGEDSVFATITSNGGAGGGGHQGAGGNGCETSYGFLENGNASGGGGSNSRTDVAGNTTKGDYGNKGGSGSSSFAGGGGGGAGSAGSNSSGGSGGAGGSGTASSITGSSVTYATGGGGHGSGSNGAGGNSSANNNAGTSSGAGNSATSNTGSGGGANSGTSRAGKGGSGIVVLKFSTSGNTFTTNGSMGWKERGTA